MNIPKTYYLPTNTLRKMGIVMFIIALIPSIIIYFAGGNQAFFDLIYLIIILAFFPFQASVCFFLMKPIPLVRIEKNRFLYNDFQECYPYPSKNESNLLFFFFPYAYRYLDCEVEYKHLISVENRKFIFNLKNPNWVFKLVNNKKIYLEFHFMKDEDVSELTEYIKLKIAN